MSESSFFFKKSVPVLCSLRRKMKGRSALKAGVRDLLSSSTAVRRTGPVSIEKHADNINAEHRGRT